MMFSFARLAIAGLLIAALCACGRKGPLDPPPAAAAPTAQAVPTEPPVPTAQIVPTAPASADSKEQLAPNGRMTVPKGPNKHIFLDDILN